MFTPCIKCMLIRGLIRSLIWIFQKIIFQCPMFIRRRQASPLSWATWRCRRCSSNPCWRWNLRRWTGISSSPYSKPKALCLLSLLSSLPFCFTIENGVRMTIVRASHLFPHCHWITKSHQPTNQPTNQPLQSFSCSLRVPMVHDGCVQHFRDSKQRFRDGTPDSPSNLFSVTSRVFGICLSFSANLAVHS